MSSASLTQPVPSGAVYTSEPIFPLTVEQYHELIRAGKLSDDDPVELLEGIPVFKMPKNTAHTTSTGLVRREIECLLPSGWHYRAQEPVTLGDSEPEPDGAVVRGRVEDYARAHPGPADIAMIVEVADTSIDRDRGIKLRCCARAGIPLYWVINLPERQLETYSDPDPAADPPAYRQLVAYGIDANVPLVLSGREPADIAVFGIVPKP